MIHKSHKPVSYSQQNIDNSSKVESKTFFYFGKYQLISNKAGRRVTEKNRKVAAMKKTNSLRNMLRREGGRPTQWWKWPCFNLFLTCCCHQIQQYFQWNSKISDFQHLISFLCFYCERNNGLWYFSVFIHSLRSIPTFWKCSCMYCCLNQQTTDKTNWIHSRFHHEYF